VLYGHLWKDGIDHSSKFYLLMGFGATVLVKTFFFSPKNIHFLFRKLQQNLYLRPPPLLTFYLFPLLLFTAEKKGWLVLFLFPEQWFLQTTSWPKWPIIFLSWCSAFLFHKGNTKIYLCFCLCAVSPSPDPYTHPLKDLNSGPNTESMRVLQTKAEMP